MAADPDRDAVRARLESLGVPVVDRSGPGWVPARPTVADPGGEHVAGSAAHAGPGAGADVGVDDGAREGAALLPGRALEVALASYTAAHGHPLDPTELSEAPRYRVATPARTAAAAVLVLALLAGGVAWRTWHRTPSVAVAVDGSGVPAGAVAGPGDGVAGPDGAGGPDAGADDGGSPAAGATGGTAAGRLVVHVVGAVVTPGVVTVPAGARVADAVAAAGGVTAEADLAAVNLARVLVDGEQVVVPVPGAGPTGAGGAAAAGGPGPLDLNRADAAALDALPGIGPVLAERIVDWRDRHGRFTAVEELTEVSGIGPALLDGVRDLVTVG